MPALALMVPLLAGVLLPVPAPPPPPATGDEPALGDPTSAPAPASSLEDALWRQVLALRAEPTATQPHAQWFDAAIRHRQALLEKLRLYLTLYPGGRYHVEAVRSELATLHELGGLRGGEFGPLCMRVKEYLREPDSDHPSVWEAAYWSIFCERFQRAAATSRPTSASVIGPDEGLLAAYRRYVARYPRSPYVPRMAAVLFEHALRAGDQAAMQQLVATLETNFPHHAVTVSLAFQSLREQTVGHPFWLTFSRPDSTKLDTRDYVGRPVLIVVWTSSEVESRRRVRRVEQFRQAHPEVRVVGVNLDESRAEMRAACGELGINWPQFNDGLGRANRFAREWGVRRVPRVFVVDRDGRLMGSTEDESWEQLARAVTGEKRR